MANACLFIGWNRAIQGREQLAMELFQTCLAYYGKLQAAGTIESFEPVVLLPHGGDMNGFILLRGDAQKLQTLRMSHEMLELETQAQLCLQGVGVITGLVGEGLQSIMQTWGKHIPKYVR
jgi:hypothetical protein